MRVRRDDRAVVSMGPINVLPGATFGDVKSISQRELRNDNAEVIRGVERGETYTVTRRGVPVARLSPFTADSDLRCVRPARRRSTYTAMSRVRADVPVIAVIDELRGDR